MKTLFIVLIGLLSFSFAQVVPYGEGEQPKDGVYELFRVIDADTISILEPVLHPTEQVGHSPETTENSGGAMSGGAVSGGAMSGGATVPEVTTVERSIRVMGIDAEERLTKAEVAAGETNSFEDAKKYAAFVLGSGNVTLEVNEVPKDSYKRGLARILLSDGEDFALTILQAGYADTRLSGTESYALVYQAALLGAQSAQKGMWAGEKFFDYNCKDFVTQAQAQAFYWGAYTLDKPDRHKLDRDKDSVVCTTLK